MDTKWTTEGNERIVFSSDSKSVIKEYIIKYKNSTYSNNDIDPNNLRGDINDIDIIDHLRREKKTSLMHFVVSMEMIQY